MSIDLDPDLDVDLSQYGLSARPFSSGTDPSVLWLGRAQRELLARLRSGVLDNAGVLLLLGDVGTGKTILANALLESLGPRVLTATVLYPRLDPLDFLKAIGAAWRLDGRLSGREEFYDRFPPFLDEAASRDKRVLLVVDEAQSLSPDLLAEIGILSDLAPDLGRTRAILNILFVGHTKVNAILSRPENAGLQRRVAVAGLTKPFSDAEVSAYIGHYLRLAGSERAVFTSEALREITTLSRGTPRLINMIGDLALLTGARRNAETIGAEIVKECAAPLGLAPRKALMLRRRAPGRRAVWQVAGLLLLAAIAGYLFGSGLAPGRFQRSARTSTDSGPPVVGASATSGVIRPEPDAGPRSAGRRREPADRPLEARGASSPEAPAERPRAHVRTSLIPLPPPRPVEPPRQPPPLPETPLPRPVPLAKSVPEERRPVASPRTGPPTLDGDVPSGPGAGAVRGGEERRSRDDDTAGDPTAIIDWLLRAHPSRQD